MTNFKKKYSVSGIGNGLVDLLVNVEDSFLARHRLEKGTFALVDLEAQWSLIESLPVDLPVSKISGGSVTNSVALIAQLGLSCSFMTSLGQDDLGQIYRQDLEKYQVALNPNAISEGESTGSCLSMITPDAARTMRTCLAVSGKVAQEHVCEDFTANSEWVLLEGFLAANSEYGQQALLTCVQIAKKHGTKIAFSFSDKFVVDFYKDFLTKLVPDCDLIFANHNEAMTYTGALTALESAQALAKICPQVVVTVSDQGAYVVQNQSISHVPAQKCQPVDLTGAGDAFAGGYLFGIISGFKPVKSGLIATSLARAVITQIGTRLDGNPLNYLKEQSLL